jgi:hypothetical protein
MGDGKSRQSIITGTGFPRVFYLAYHMYRLYFPLLALTSYQRAMERNVQTTHSERPETAELVRKAKNDGSRIFYLNRRS